MTDYEACVAYCRSGRTMADVAHEHGVTLDEMCRIVNDYGGYMHDPGIIERHEHTITGIPLEPTKPHTKAELEAMTQRAYAAYKQARLHYLPNGSRKEIDLALKLALDDGLCLRCIAKAFFPRSYDTIRLWCIKYGEEWINGRNKI